VIESSAETKKFWGYGATDDTILGRESKRELNPKAEKDNRNRCYPEVNKGDTLRSCASSTTGDGCTRASLSLSRILSTGQFNLRGGKPSPTRPKTSNDVDWLLPCRIGS